MKKSRLLLIVPFPKHIFKTCKAAYLDTANNLARSMILSQYEYWALITLIELVHFSSLPFTLLLTSLLYSSHSLVHFSLPCRMFSSLLCTLLLNPLYTSPHSPVVQLSSLLCCIVLLTPLYTSNSPVQFSSLPCTLLTIPLLYTKRGVISICYKKGISSLSIFFWWNKKWKWFHQDTFGHINSTGCKSVSVEADNLFI